MRPLRILALSGSIRRGSTNAGLLRAAVALAPPGLTIAVFDSLGALPHFNPDFDAPDAPLPPAVSTFRAAVGMSDGVLIASPEYAHGIPGSLKNALDWLVSGAEFPGKPVALCHATTRGTHAREALREVLHTMNGEVVDVALFTVPLLGGGTTPEAIAAHGEWAATIRSGLERFAAAIHARSAPQGEAARPMPT